MLTVLNRLLLSPSIWLTAGLLCLGASIFLGYHQDQMEAEAALAEKVAMSESAVVPGPGGDSERSFEVQVTDYSAEENVLFWASAVMISFGLMFSVFPSFKRTKKKSAAKVKAVSSFPEMGPFQQIVDQDEIGDETEDEPAPKTSRIMTVATNVFRPKSRP